MHRITALTIEDVTVAASACATRAYAQPLAAGAQPIHAVHGIPRGGLTPAALVARFLDLPLVGTPAPGVLVVDDLVDSGATAYRYLEAHPGIHFDALYRKAHAPAAYAPDALTLPAGTWATFPWEHTPDTDGTAPPTEAVVRLLQWIGEDPTRPGLVDTPARVTRAWAEMTAGYTEDPAAILSTTFPDTCDEMVLVHGIDFVSLCEHHVLPFTGTCSIGYLPGDRVVGLSKLPRLVNAYAHRLQVQERLTSQVAQAIMDHLHARGCGVLVTAHHSCMSCRGVRQANARMTTSALLGTFRDETPVRDEFLALALSHPTHT